MKTIIAANWKMHKTVSESLDFLKKFKFDSGDIIVIICPPYTSLYAMSGKTDISLGAQNMYFEKEGAFTSEISGAMIKELCEYVIIGHSERRHIFNEDNSMINKKVKAALEIGLKPILCVGETLEEREASKTESVVKEQLRLGLEGVDVDKMIVAYEPVWAIGTGKTASPAQAEEVHSLIREIVGSKVPILYGGSVKPGNVKELMNEENINGALVGGASLDPNKFSELIENAK